MNTRTRRGFAVVALIPYLLVPLVIAGGWQAYKVFQPGRNKAKAEQVAQSAADTKSQAAQADTTAAAVKAAVTEANESHAKEIATHRAVEGNAAVFVEASKQVLKSDPSPSAEVLIALDLNDAALTALGVSLTPEQLRLVKGLIQKNAESAAEIARLKTEAAATRASLDAVTARAAEADTHAAALTTQLKDQTSRLANTSARAATLAEENRQWADGQMTLWGRIKALGWLSVILAAIAMLIGFKFLGVRETLRDAVALIEHVKDAAISAGHDAVELEKNISAWWGGAKGEKVVAEIKDKVLRL